MNIEEIERWLVGTLKNYLKTGAWKPMAKKGVGSISLCIRGNQSYNSKDSRIGWTRLNSWWKFLAWPILWIINRVARWAEGMKQWPPLMFSDICQYLLAQDSSLPKRLVTDYKEGKAFSYFKSYWLNYLIAESSSYCFLKAECSQRVPHTL